MTRSNTTPSTEEQNCDGLTPQSIGEKFEEFLDLTMVPTTLRGVARGSILPAEYVVNESTLVSLGIHEELENEQLQTMSILVHKDEMGIVRRVTVHCSCGCSASITIDYDDE